MWDLSPVPMAAPLVFGTVEGGPVRSGIHFVEPPEEPEGPELPTCTAVYSSWSAVQSAVNAAQPGDVICVADGSYGNVTITANKAAPGVIIRAANPGGAVLGAVTVSNGAKGISLERFKMTRVQIQQSCQRIRVKYNRITPTGYGVFLFGDSGVISDVQIIGNDIEGNGTNNVSSENDLINLHNFKEVLIEGNKLHNIYEPGNHGGVNTHTDIFQTVHGGNGLIIRKNYVTNQRGTQGLFIKDGKVTNVTIENNLIVHDTKANGYPLSIYECVPDASQPYYTGYGALVRNNTIWDDSGQISARGSANRDVRFEKNVRQSSPTSGSPWIESGSTGELVDNIVGGSPAFRNPSVDDYRLVSGDQGVDWAPADQHYGP